MLSLLIFFFFLFTLSYGNNCVCECENRDHKCQEKCVECMARIECINSCYCAHYNDRMCYKRCNACEKSFREYYYKNVHPEWHNNNQKTIREILTGLLSKKCADC